MTLMTQLFLSVQSRPDADMAELFRFENKREPLSLVDHGSLRTGKKSDRFSQISHSCCAGHGSCCSYGEAYISKDICRLCYTTHRPFLEYQITLTVERIDAIWDNYPEGNLKSLTHQRRGTGLRTRIGDGHTQIPKHELNSGFLKTEENKKELFSFLSEEIVKKDLGGKLLLSTKCERVLSNGPCDVSALEPCNHSESDTMVFRHLAHASGQGHQTAYMLEQLIVIS